MDFGTNKPIYQHIYDIVVERIIIGQLREGDRVPSVRELAVELQVNPNTVMRAYESLCSNGIIASSRGIGYFVADGASSRALEESRKEFIEGEMATLFRRMTILGISAEELTKLFINYQNEQKNENKQ